MDQELNPGLLHWELAVLTAGPPGKSPEDIDFKNIYIYIYNIKILVKYFKILHISYI